MGVEEVVVVSSDFSDGEGDVPDLLASLLAA